MAGKKTYVLCLLILSLIIPEVRGIPNSVGVVNFTNLAGMRLEDFAAQEAIWEEDGELKGNWELWRDESVTDSTIELLHLTLPAVVFGVTASEVTVQRRDEQIIQFQVVFEPNEQITSFDKLSRIVRTNASFWSGSETSESTMKQGASTYTFSENPDEERCVVTITPQ